MDRDISYALEGDTYVSGISSAVGIVLDGTCECKMSVTGILCAEIL